METLTGLFRTMDSMGISNIHHNIVEIDSAGRLVANSVNGAFFSSRLGWNLERDTKALSLREFHRAHLFPVDAIDSICAVASGDSEGFETEFEFDDGSLYQAYRVSVSKSPERENSALLHYHAISVRKMSRDQLIKKANLNRNLLDHIPAGVFFQDFVGRMRLANPAAEVLLGLTEDELYRIEKESVPWKILDVNGDELPFENHPGNAALFTHKSQRNRVCQVLLPDSGFIRWVKAQSEPIFDVITGELIGALTSFVDINEERLVKNALQTLTERSQVAIESAEMGVWDWIPEQALMIWDSKMFSLYGCEECDHITPKEAFDRAIHPDDVERVNREVRLLLRGIKNAQLDFRVIWPDTSIHYLRAKARLKLDSKGKVERIVGVTHDITVAVESEEKLQQLAFCDDLTGCLSRSGLKQKLDSLLSEKNFSIGVILIGLDRFKDINDNYGHPVGDALLIDLTRRFQRIVSDQLVLARMGGDEFVIVIPEQSTEKRLQGIAEQIRSILVTPFYLDVGPVVSVQASIGLASNADANDSTELLRAADLAMNNAKNSGGNNIAKYQNAMLEAINKRYTLQSKLQDAVYAEEFMLYYQPIIDFHSQKVIGCEALIRWQDENDKFVSPEEFIPIIEECGLIYSLGKWICKTAIHQLKMWQHLVSDLQYISINVSPLQLNQPTFSDELMELVDFNDINPNLIQLEITEGTFLQESKNADSILNRLAEKGFRLAIDDFGTGYSSLAYLKRFNVDVIKVDRSFIIDIETDQSDRDIVSAILAMNSKLGFKTLVEGIETSKQAEIVKDLGCDSAQGYLYGKPTFADEFAELYLSKYLISKQKTA